MNNIIDRVWKQSSMTYIEDLQGSAFSAESGGHTFRISGVDSEENPLALSGSVAASFLRPDQATVAISGAVSGGVVSVTLPANCYDIPGRFGLVIFLTSDGQKTAIYSCVGNVARSSTSAVAPQTTADVVDLINQINAAVATIPASYTNLMAAVAPTYSSSALYPVGAYAWNDGKLYRAISPITTAESWTAAHWIIANLGDDVRDLKSAINTIKGGTKNLFAFKEGTFNGVTFKYLPDGGLSVVGTATTTANNIVSLNKGYYGNYSLTVDSVSQSFTTGQLIVVLRRQNGTQQNSINMSGTHQTKSASNPEEYQFDKIDITVFNGVTYNTVLYIQLEMQIPATEFISPFTAFDRIARENIDSTKLDVETLSASIDSKFSERVPFSVITENGKYVTSSNSTPPYSTAICTDIFNVTPGEIYKINSCAFASAQAYILLDADNHVIAYENNSAETWNEFTVTIPTTAKFMRCSSTRADNFYVVRIENRTGNIEKQITDDADNAHILTNKIWYACGDSFTHGDFSGVETPYISSGKYAGQIAVYPFLIGNRTNANVVNMAQNGGTIAESGQNGVYALSRDGNYNSIPADTDYVTIMIGINDSGKNIPIGTIDDADNTTFYGAWNVVLSWLRQNRPFTKVGIIISLSLHDEYRVAELAVAKKYGYPFLNLPEDETLPAFLWAHRANISSDIQNLVNNQQRVSPTNFHPNEDAHKLLSTVIQKWIEGI